jgi:hypothetical protein
MPMDKIERAGEISQFLMFLHEMRETLAKAQQSNSDPAVQTIRGMIEDHYTDDQGKPAVYIAMESALYDDAPAIIALWNRFEAYDNDQLRRYRRLIEIELSGLNGDRHPRKVFDRSPFGLAALIIGTITIWMTFLRIYSGEDLGPLLELIRFNAIVGVLWIVGMFLVVWYIVRTHRNNLQVAHLATVARAIDLYLD